MPLARCFGQQDDQFKDRLLAPTPAQCYDGARDSVQISGQWSVVSGQLERSLLITDHCSLFSEGSLMKETKRSFLLGPPDVALPASLAFLRHARFRLREDYWIKIETALDLLDDEQVWRRPNEASNSIGNLVLHLSGNARQWMIAGVGGADDVRDRPREFIERDGISKENLLDLMKSTLDEVDGVMAKLESEVIAAHSDAPLQRECIAQGFKQTVLDAIFHVVEHFSYHTGQIVYIAKWLEEGRERFYDDQLLD